MNAVNVIEQVEAIVESVVDSLLDETELTIQLATRTVCFPGKRAEEARQFTLIFRILEIIHDAHLRNVTCTKRDIYYQDPVLFGKQQAVDRLVDEIASTFGVTRAALNVVASAKGLMAGAFDLRRSGGRVVQGWSDREGILIPNLEPEDAFNLRAVKWVLVVEKEAVFHTLLESPFWNTFRNQGILVTGKGFPDLATRKLLYHLNTKFQAANAPTPPIYGLFDYDPDGLAIYSTYRAGSRALAHESASTVPSMRWLGMHTASVFSARALLQHEHQRLPQLSMRDRARATSMLGWHGGPENWRLEGWHRELQVMLMLGFKAEIQLLDALHGGLAGWVESQIVV